MRRRCCSYKKGRRCSLRIRQLGGRGVSFQTLWPMPVQAVTDGQTGKPVDGAEVNGQNSNSSGQATITLSSTGGFASAFRLAVTVKAQKDGTIVFDRIDISSTSFRRSPKGPEVAQKGVMNCTSSIIMLSSLSFS
jgi:hypothetical protein